MTSERANRPLRMKISLNVLEHLGMNLYSNVPAVLSEIVANAWDADANHVLVQLGDEAISIEDDGVGMTRDEVIDRFLNVGFQRRLAMSPSTPSGRRPMGRKGIGKLSSFSIARVVSVYTGRAGEQTAFRMDAAKIRERMNGSDQGAYDPEELNHVQQVSKGTRIVLTGLKRSVTQHSENGLRQRIARRFSVIGPQHNFKVDVDGTTVSPEDRGYCEHVEYCWTYGDQKEKMNCFTGLAEGQPSDRTAEMARAVGTDLTITGWIGTVRRPNFLKAQDGENLNRLAIFMRGRVAQEDILGDFGFKQIFSDYIVGEIHCDDLDEDDGEDIATSSRQSLKYDDAKFETVRKAVCSELRHIASQWTDLRNLHGSKILCKEVPAVEEWLATMRGSTKKKAENWIGRLNVLRSSDHTKRELLKASILAFESYRRKEQLEYLEKISNERLEPILSVFKDIDDLEFSYYGQIVNLRLGVITTLEEKLREDQKEAVIRDHIYDHLWLLDPSWERVKGSESMESRITTFLNQKSKNLSEDESRARIDIGYRTAQGRHVIIELKRASVSISVDDLTRQIRKYRDGARELIAQSDYQGWPLDIVCLVGKPPPEWGLGQRKEDVERTLRSVDARLMFYGELLDHARNAYADYLEKHKKIDKLWKIFEGINDFAALPRK